MWNQGIVVSTQKAEIGRLGGQDQPRLQSESVSQKTARTKQKLRMFRRREVPGV